MSGYDDIVAQMKSSQATTGDSPYDDAVQQLKQQDDLARGQAALSLGMSADQNPDRAAVNRSLAKRYNTAPEVVDKFPDEFRQRMATETARDALAKAPVLQGHINQNPQLAPVVHDDIRNAAAIEQVVQGFYPADMAEWKPSMGQRVMQWVGDAFGLNDRDRAQAANQFAAQRSGMSVGDARTALGGMSEVPEQAINKAINTASLGLLPDLAGEAQTEAGGIAGGAGALAGFIGGAPLKGAEYLGSKIGISMLEHKAGESFAKALAKDVAGQATKLGAAGALAQTGNAINSPDVATALQKEGQAAATNATVGAVFGGAGRLLPDSTVSQAVARFAGISAALDASQGKTPFKDFSNWETLTPQQKGEAVFNYGLNALFSMKGAGRAEGGWFHDAAKADIAMQDHQNLGAISELATASKWRERDPDGFKDYMNAVTEDGKLENVYIDGQTFAQEMLKAGVTLDELKAKMPDVAQQMNEALESDGMVRIPTADYATHIAGGKMDGALLQHLKTDPEGYTYAEAQEFQQKQAETFKDMALKAAEEKQADDAWKQSQQAVHDDILRQLDEVGHTSHDVNKVYAALHSNMLAEIARQEGTTPEEAHAKYGVGVVGAGKGELEQGGTPADLRQQWSDAGIKIDVSEKDGIITLSRIVVPEGERSAGKGTAAMQSLVEYADRTGQHVALSPSSDFGGNKNRLVQFYKRFGFVENKGKNRVFTTSESMYRQAQGKVLHQNTEQQDVRGFYSPAEPTIGLLKDADLSTFVHETGHWALDTYAKIAAAPDAPAKIKADMGELLEWFGVESLDKWNAMSLDEQRPHHEQLARGFESYFMEGKAPSLELQSTFSRIKSWMVSVYKSLRSLNVQLTPEVRGVFDRMLASEDAIREAEQARGYWSLFSEKPEGVSEADWQDYQQLGADATRDSIDTMTGKSLRDMQWLSGAKSRAMRELQKQADGERKAIRAEVEKEIDQEPVYKAERWLRKGEMVDEKGDIIATTPEARKGAKLNSARLGEMYPEGDLSRPNMEKLKGMTSPKGLDPDLVAEMFGFPSGDALVRSLAGMEPRTSVLEGMTDRYMLERHGELATPDAVERAAEEAIHNDARARFMATGLKILTKSPISARQLVKGAKEAADAAIAARKVRDVNPKQHEAAEAKANKEALKLAPKDPAGAVSAQRSALLNNQLGKSAEQALTDIQKGLDYFKKLDKDSVREKIDVAFRDQIDALLARYDLRVSLTPEEANAKNLISLESFVEKLAAMKFSVDVPEKMIVDANRMHYKDMPVEDFRGLVDAVKSIEHLGREVQKITDGNEKRMIDEVAQEAADQAATLPQHNIATNRGLSLISKKWLDAKAFGRSVQASLLKVEQMMDWLDNRNPLGVFNRMVFRKIADAEAARNDLDLKITQRIQAYVKQLPKEVIKEGRGNIEMPGVIDAITGQTQRLTWGEKISLAAIRGDAGHFAKLLKGEKWDAQAVLAFLDKNMTKEEWHFVRGLADQFQEIHPLKVEMLRDLGSTAPKEVERVPFQTPHGEMPGWYWPISYDPARSHSVKERSAKHGASIFEDNIYSRADTSTGREQTRNDNYAKPMLLSIDTFPRVLKDEIRDITTRKAIIEADRFLSHPDVRRAITGALSEQHYDMLNGWLLSLANDAAAKPSELQMWDRVAHEIRTRTTMVGLGFRISTMIMHGATAAGESVAEAGFKPMANGIFDKRTAAALTKALGPEWLTKGLENFIRSDQWVANRDFIFDRSAEMRHRSNEFERDVREKLRDIDIELMDPATGAAQRAKLAIQSRAYQGIAMLDMASALPTWMGAYLKGIEKTERGGLGYGEDDAVYFADKTVRNAHGGGGVKDMAFVQRGGEWFKLFTMFYTFWNHNINRLMDTARRAKEVPEGYRTAQETGDWGKFRGDVGTLILRSMMYTLGVQAVHHMMHPPKDGDEPDTWAVWFAKQMAMSAFSGVPLFRDIAGHYAGGKDYEVSPIAAAIHNTDMLAKDMEGTAKSDKWIKHALTEAGYVFGMPFGQPASTAQFLSDVWDGKQHPQDVTDWWRGVLHGDMNTH